MSLQTNISDTPFNQKYPQTPEDGVLDCHSQTDRTATEGYCNYMTESAQWVDLLKIGVLATFLGNGTIADLIYGGKRHYQS